MQATRSYWVLSGAILAAILLLGGLMGRMRAGGPGVLAQSGPGVYVVRHVLGQQEVGVIISGTNLNNVGGFEADLRVDSRVARMSGMHLGAFLARSGRSVGSLGPLVGSQGEVIGFGGYSYDASGNNAAGASGDGVLAYVTMTVAVDGVSRLTLENVIVADVDANPQAVTVGSAALQVRTLHPGWNLVAPCVDTRGLAVRDVMESLENNYDLVVGDQGVFAATLSPVYSTLTEMVPPWGYWVRVTETVPVTLTLVGGQFDATAPITLTTGWHIVGYCVGASQPVSVALQSVAGKYTMVIGEGGVYVPNLLPVYQTLQYVEQGRAYAVRMSGDGVLRYPTPAPLSYRERREEMRSRVSGSGCEVSRTPYMTLVYGQVRVNGRPAPEGTVVEAVTPRGEVAGCFEVHSAGYFGVMQVYGADESGEIPGFRAGERVIWRVNGQEVGASLPVIWQDDKDVHEVGLEVGGAVEHRRQFVPWVSK